MVEITEAQGRNTGLKMEAFCFEAKATPLLHWMGMNTEDGSERGASERQLEKERRKMNSE